MQFSSVDGKHSVSLPVSQKALDGDIATVKLVEKITLGWEEDGIEKIEMTGICDYDGENRLKTLIKLYWDGDEDEDSDDTYVTDYTYESNKVIVTEEYMEDGIIESGTTIYEFEDGKLQRITDDEGFEGVFEYNAGGAKPVKYDTNGDINYEFSWDAFGNLTKLQTEYYLERYTYSDVQDRFNIDFRAMFDSDVAGLPILFDKEVFKCISSPNLPNSVDDTIYKYEYDSDGYVTKIIILSDDEEHTFLKISYE